MSDEVQAIAVMAKDDSKPCEIVEGQLYLGSMQASMNVTALTAHKVTHIINCVPDLHKVWIKFKQYPAQFSYLNLDLADTPQEDITRVFDTCHQFIENALQNNGRVFVHCAQGVSRSASVLIMYLIKTRGISYDEAFELVRVRRPLIKPNLGFIEQLKMFARKTNGKN
jgi:protein-tyrosine phosphatase